MPLDPQAETLLAAVAQANLPPVNELTPHEGRAQMVAASGALGKPESVHAIEDRKVVGPDGEIPVRIYRPRLPGESLPVVVYFHGGGWVVGSIDTHDGYCRALAKAAKAVVVSVDYRLAPEHKFPAPAQDAYAATCWVGEHLAELDGREGALAVAGDSAGGNLAAAVALMARDQGGPEIAKQLLFYPITDCDFETPSYRDFATGYYLTRDAMVWFWDQYCGVETNRTQPYLSPLRADDLTGLPAAYVMTAGYDPLRDEGDAYAAKLKAAGVNVTHRCYEGMIHGFIRRLNLFDKAREALHEVTGVVRSLVQISS